MTRQIASGTGPPSAAILEERIRRLENAVAGLTRAVDALVRRVAELTDTPPEPGGPPHGASGRRAHEASFESRRRPHHGFGDAPHGEPPCGAGPSPPVG